MGVTARAHPAAEAAMAGAVRAMLDGAEHDGPVGAAALVGREWRPCLACDSLDLDPEWILDGLPPLCVRCAELWGRSYDLDHPPEPAWWTEAGKVRVPFAWGWPQAVVRGQLNANALPAAKAAWLRGWDIGRWCGETGGFAVEHPDYLAMLAEARAGRFPLALQEAAQAGCFAGGRTEPAAAGA